VARSQQGPLAASFWCASDNVRIPKFQDVLEMSVCTELYLVPCRQWLVIISSLALVVDILLPRDDVEFPREFELTWEWATKGGRPLPWGEGY